STAYALTINPVSEPPTLTGTIGTANEGGAVTLGLTVATIDVDDVLGTVTISGLANDLSGFSGGNYDAEAGTWTGSASDFNALSFTAGEDGVSHLTVTAITTGAEAGTTTQSYDLTISPVSEPPLIT